MHKRFPKAHVQLVNKFNKVKVLNVIREQGPISRTKAADLANISNPTASRIVGELIDDQLVVELGLSTSPSFGGGRPPLMVEFDGKNNFVIGVDIGTTHTIGILANLDAEVVSEIKIPTHVQAGLGPVMEQTHKIILDLIRASQIDRERTIRGVGIGVAGLIDRHRKTLRFSPDFGWKDVQIIEELQKDIPYPIVFDNVTRVMAMGEICYGVGKKYRNFICINIGYGIGAGIVQDGKLILGTRGMAGEFGHITLVREGGPQCDCGNTGCLESLASGRGIALAARERLQQGEKSILRDWTFSKPERISAELVFRAAGEGDTMAREVVKEAAEYIGIGISSLINLFNPEAIVIGGGVSNAGETLFAPIRDTIRERALSQSAEGVEILPARFGDRATVIGAVSLVLYEVLNLNSSIQTIPSDKTLVSQFSESLRSM